MNPLSYFLTASLYLLLFYTCYWLLLRRNTFFGLNRLYLLASVVLSLLLPLLDVSAWWSVETRNPVGTITLPTFGVGRQATAETQGLSASQWGWLIYGLGALVMLVRLGLNLRALFRLIRQGDITNYQTYILVRLHDDATPSFSFGRFLVLNQTDSRLQPDALIRHEEAHIRQHHTTDVLFIELMRVAFWFHPVLWLYKRALQEVHEFLADRAVLRTPQPDYARQLVAYALDVPVAALTRAALTTPFVSMSTLKQRIVMLQKPQSNRRALLGYALVLPLAGLLTLCTQPDRDSSETQLPATIKPAAERQAGIEGEVFNVVEKQPEFPGGMNGLATFLQKTLRYPAPAQKAKVQGRVFLSFIVTKEGDVADVKILKGMGFGTDEEAIRVMKAMPRWLPGSQSGQPVNVRYVLPINFELDDNTNDVANTFPTDAAEIQRRFKHFIVDNKEVSLDEFKKNLADGGSNIVEISSSDQTVRLRTTPPPPPPPVPANEASALNNVKTFTINGKPATKADVQALSPDNIARVDVNKNQRTLAVTTK